MRMSIALPIAAALAAATIGLSIIPPALAKDKNAAVNSCNTGRSKCHGNCSMYSDGEFKRSCRNRCEVGWTECLREAAVNRPGGGGVKVGGGKTGGVLSGNTNGGKPNPKAPIFGGSNGTIGGGVVKYNKR